MNRIKTILDAYPALKGRGSILVLKGADGPNPRSYRRGHIVDVLSDRSGCSGANCMPTFAHVWFPLVSREMIHRRWTKPRYGLVDTSEIIEKRRWQFRVDLIPAAARQQILDTGALIIKARDAYAGPYDYTGAQVKNYVWDRLNDRAEAVDV